MLPLADLTAYLQTNPLLVASRVEILPGPDYHRSPNPGRLLIVSPNAGAGTTTDDLFDQPFFQVRSVGQQGDYADAEALAFAVDSMLFSTAGVQMGATRTLRSQRVGGGPSLLVYDEADRYHFVGTYLIEHPTKVGVPS